MFLDIGERCFYVPERGERGPLCCTVISKEVISGGDRIVLGIEIEGRPDNILGERFFSEVPLHGQRFIEKIVDARCYVRNMAWLSGNPKYGDDIVEIGFLCTEIGLKEYFPTLRQKS